MWARYSAIAPCFEKLSDELNGAKRCGKKICKGKQLNKQKKSEKKHAMQYIDDWDALSLCTCCCRGFGALFYVNDQILSLEITKSAIRGNSNSQVFHTLLWSHTSFKVKDEVYNYTPRPESKSQQQ